MELISYLAKLQLLPCRCAGCLQHPLIQTYQLREQAHHVSAQYIHNERNSKKVSDATQIRLRFKHHSVPPASKRLDRVVLKAHKKAKKVT